MLPLYETVAATSDGEILVLIYKLNHTVVPGAVREALWTEKLAGEALMVSLIRKMFLFEKWGIIKPPQFEERGH